MSKNYDRRSFLKTTVAASSVGLGVAAAANAGASDAQAGESALAATPPYGMIPSASDRHRQSLLDYMAQLEVIDGHQHLWPERERVAVDADVLLLFHTYAFNDLISAGMKTKPGENAHGANILRDTETPLEERWKAVSPYLEQIKYGTSYRATQIALRGLYGIDDLNDRTYQEASEKIRASNKPGLYRWVLRDHCKIRTCLVQSLVNEGYVKDLEPRDLMTRIFSGPTCYQLHYRPFIDTLNESYGISIQDLDTYLETLTRLLSELRADGVAGFKYYQTKPLVPLDRAAAAKAFTDWLAGGPVERVLECEVMDHVFKLAADWDWPISVHCGGAYMDFRTFDTRDIIELLIRYPGTRFDLFHLGVPFPREVIFIAKQYPNASLNLCWCAVLSESMTRQALNEIIDAVPVNKVIAFGADYAGDVENTYGHLVMVRETLAEALAERIAYGRLDLDAAKEIAKMWLFDNAARIYRLSWPS